MTTPITAVSGGWQLRVKSGADRAFALLAVLALAPLLLLIAMGIRLSSIGPVIFRQRRVGHGGETFVLFKFRTMAKDLGAVRFTPADGTAPGGIEGVDRCTAVGRWLRTICLDELPQLLNVLRGEMSLIGPRPERPEFVELFAMQVPGYTNRHRVKSGITGWAQVHGLRGQTSIADRVELDNYYIDNWSIGLDLRILALTVVELLRFRDGRAAPVTRAARNDNPAARGQSRRDCARRRRTSRASAGDRRASFPRSRSRDRDCVKLRQQPLQHSALPS